MQRTSDTARIAAEAKAYSPDPRRQRDYEIGGLRRLAEMLEREAEAERRRRTRKEIEVA